MSRQDAKHAKKLFGEPPLEADAIARRVIGAAIEVHRHLGPGFLESVYEEALAVEFGLCNIPYERQRPVGIVYKGIDVGRSRPDFFVETELVVEVKAVESLIRAHTAQVISYLRAFDRPLGLLLNFQVPILKQGGIKRVVLTDRGGKILGGLGVLAAKEE